MPTLYKPKAKPRYQDNRRTEAHELYNTPLWKRLRLAHLQEFPLCQRCLDELNIITPAVQVHHIKPFSWYDGNERIQLFYDYNNLMSLCIKCHQIIEQQTRNNK